MDSFSLSLKYYKVSLRIRRARTITIGPPKISSRKFLGRNGPKKGQISCYFPPHRPRAAPRLSEVEGCCAWWRSWPSLSTLPSSAFTFAVRPRCGADRIAGSRAKNRGGGKNGPSLAEKLVVMDGAGNCATHLILKILE